MQKKKRSVRGTRTEQNLLKAFAGESQARNRYTFFAEIARKEGYELVSEIFKEVAHNERAHAKMFFALMEGGMVEVTAAYPAGVIGNTIENLAAAAEGEYDEWSNLYPEYAQVAKDEGFLDVALAFEGILEIERSHQKKFHHLKCLLEQKKMFSRDRKIEWICRECGYVHNGEVAPGICPVCGKPQSYFEPVGCPFDGVDLDCGCNDYGECCCTQCDCEHPEGYTDSKKATKKRV